jgi:hypothetical protein
VRLLSSESRRLLSALSGAAFLFFILFTAPHLVHHSFDDSQPSACQAFAIAKGCHIQPVSVAGIFTRHVALETFLASLPVWIPRLAIFPFSQRAPPVA